MSTYLLAILLEHMHKKFEINLTKIKGGFQSGRKEVNPDSNSDLPLAHKGISKKLTLLYKSYLFLSNKANKGGTG